MNTEMRKQIQELRDDIKRALACLAVEDISSLADIEREKFDDMSEGLQASENGQRIDEAASALQEAADQVESAVSALEEADSLLETAAG